MTMIKKSFAMEYKMTGVEDRIFEGYGSTFGNKDLHGDIITEGAFSKSIQSKRPAMLIHHDLNRPIGVWEEVREDSKGLFVRGRLTEGVKDSDEAYALMKDGAISSMSIGFIPVEEEYDYKSKTNYIKEIDLWEVSLVTIPANPQATVGAVKDAEGKVNIRELEIVLRDAGLSRREAKALLSEGFNALKEPEELKLADVIAMLDKFNQK